MLRSALAPLAPLALLARVALLAPVALFAASGAAAGCSSPAGGAEILSWRFADGRDCFNAGATLVELRTSSSLLSMPLATTRCPSGLLPATFTLDPAPGGGTLYLDAVDNLGTDLYRGALPLDAAPPGTGETRVVTLYAAAAQ